PPRQPSLCAPAVPLLWFQFVSRVGEKGRRGCGCLLSGGREVIQPGIPHLWQIHTRDLATLQRGLFLMSDSCLATHPHTILQSRLVLDGSTQGTVEIVFIPVSCPEGNFTLLPEGVDVPPVDPAVTQQPPPL
ncbi:hypothetical protein KUCAC02_010796, partial [Chaenocephalus aceratus]